MNPWKRPVPFPWKYNTWPNATKYIWFFHELTDTSQHALNSRSEGAVLSLPTFCPALPWLVCVPCPRTWTCCQMPALPGCTGTSWTRCGRRRFASTSWRARSAATKRGSTTSSSTKPGWRWAKPGRKKKNHSEQPFFSWLELFRSFFFLEMKAFGCE